MNKLFVVPNSVPDIVVIDGTKTKTKTLVVLSVWYCRFMTSTATKTQQTAPAILGRTLLLKQ